MARSTQIGDERSPQGQHDSGTSGAARDTGGTMLGAATSVLGSAAVQRKLASRVQRKAGGGTEQAEGQAQVHAAQPGAGGGGEVFTITDGQSLVRGGPPKFEQTKDTIPTGTRVEVLEEQSAGNKKYIRVKDHETGKELGWTSRGNADDLDKKYAAAGASHVYFAGGHSLMVYVPQGGIKGPSVEVFMFFHGVGGDYSTTKTNKKDGGFADNTGISADLPAAVSGSGRNVVAICPQAKYSPEWSAIKPADYKTMADAALAHLSVDLGLEKPLVASVVSLAGHSKGGAALGPAAAGMDAQDVTLQDAGYGWYTDSWSQLREWFVTGKPTKHLRIISKDADGKDNAQSDWSTRHAEYYALAQGDIEAVAKQHKLANVIVTPVKADKTTARDAGMTLDGGFDLMIDGAHQGSLRVFTIKPHTKKNNEHWGVKDESMAATIRAGTADDSFATKK